MSLALGIFDVFTYAVPGFLYVALAGYAADRLGWVRLPAAGELDTLALAVTVAVVSYLAGHLTYGLGALSDRVLEGFQGRGTQEAKRRFVERARHPLARSLAATDIFVLLSAAEIRAKDAAIEISRLRAAGLMLRNCVPAFLAAAAVAFAELVAGAHPLPAACAAAVLLACAVAAARRGGRLRDWATVKTFEVALWVLDEAEVAAVTGARRPPEGRPEHPGGRDHPDRRPSRPGPTAVT